MTLFFIEHSKRYSMIPGVIESFTGIIDFADVGVTEIPVSII